MKQLVENGEGGHTTLVVGSGQPWARFKKHDSWGAHGNVGTLDASPGSDGSKKLQTISNFNALLKSGIRYYYFYANWVNCFNGILLPQRCYSYQVYGISGVWVGEGFNFLMRPQCSAKLTLQGLRNMQALHGADETLCP